MNRHPEYRVVLLTLALLSTGTGCNAIRKLHGRPAVERPVATQVGSKSAQSVLLQQPHRVVAPGMVEPWRGQIDLSPQEPGWIAQILVAEGQRVQAGQVIALLDDAPQRAAVDIAKAEVAEADATLRKTVRGATREEIKQAEADVEASRALAERAERDANRSTQLGSTSAISTAEVDRARAEAQAQLALTDKSHARLEQLHKGASQEDRSVATHRLLAAKGRLDLALANLARRHVASPAPGVVLHSRFHAGEYFNVGGEPLFVLGDVSRLQVRLEIDEIDAFRVTIGQNCALYGDDDATLGNGRIYRLAPMMGRRGLKLESPTARADVRVREVFLEVAASDTLVPGRRVWGHVEIDSAPQRQSHLLPVNNP